LAVQPPPTLPLIHLQRLLLPLLRLPERSHRQRQRDNLGLELTQSRLNSATTAGVSSSSVKKSKLGLGASKTKPVDFAEAERRAREEEEKTKQLGYNREREETEERSRKEAEAVKLAQDLQLKVTINSRDKGTTNMGDKIVTSTANPQKSAAFPRLGFGAIPGAGAAAAVSSASAATSRKATPIMDDTPTTARDKFGNQKAISSDMFFSRGSYDVDQVREAQTRLQTFQGATSISSNQYFGRDEEDSLSREDVDGSLLGDGSLAGFESAAKDAIAKVLANPDVQNIGESIRTGALKVMHVNFVIDKFLIPSPCSAFRLLVDNVRTLIGSARFLSLPTLNFLISFPFS
jgi:ADP-ribosylation factor GTPase-activating protein 2/3